MTPINRAQGLFVLREILSEGTDKQQIDTQTIGSLALDHVKASRRSIEVDPVELADGAGISWNKTLYAIERLTKIGAFLCVGGRYAINPYVGQQGPQPIDTK
jgi:hypothetical protein